MIVTGVILLLLLIFCFYIGWKLEDDGDRSFALILSGFGIIIMVTSLFLLLFQQLKIITIL